MATVTRVYKRDTSAALARRRARTPEQQAAIQADLERMADDPEYKAQQRELESEFDQAGREALERAEAS